MKTLKLFLIILLILTVVGCKKDKPRVSIAEVVEICNGENLTAIDNLLSKLAIKELSPKEIFDVNYDNKYDPGFIDNVTHIKRTEKIKTDDKEEYYYYDITATPGHKYVEISKMLDYYAGFSTEKKWYLEWSGE